MGETPDLAEKHPWNHGWGTFGALLSARTGSLGMGTSLLEKADLNAGYPKGNGFWDSLSAGTKLFGVQPLPQGLPDPQPPLPSAWNIPKKGSMLASAPKECRSHSPLHGRSSCSSRRRCRRGKSLISFFQHEGKAQSIKIWSRSAGGSLGWEHMEPAPPGTPGWAWKCLNHPKVRRGNRAQPVWGARSTPRWLKDKKAAKFPFPERKSIAGVSEIPPGLGRAPEGRNPPFLLGSAPKHHWIPREERNPLNLQQRSRKALQAAQIVFVAVEHPGQGMVVNSRIMESQVARTIRERLFTRARGDRTGGNGF